jgi:DNA polymerase I-like protein with 3'-5' exonuclease and polymerase domains
MYDVSWLRSTGLILPKDVRDTMIAASLVDENRLSYRLDTLAKEYAGVGKDEAVLQAAAKEYGINPKKDLWKLPSMFVGQYAERDAESTLKLWHEMKIEINKQDLVDIFDMETKLFPCLVDMRFKGVRVDVEKAEKIKQRLIEEEKKLLFKIKELTKIDVELWAAASIAKAFDALKLPYDKTEKTGAPSFTRNFLANHPHELAQSIANAREINKAHTTFIDTITKHSYKGRIHADINQIRSDQGGTVTGRFSMSNPNLQQIPVRHKELGPLIRSIFIPEENCKWGVFDYSQQEPRILVHYAKLQKLDGIDEIANAYISGEADFHAAVAKMAGISRNQAKTINLGLFYGMGKAKLQAELGLNTKEETEVLFNQYHNNVPFVKELMNKTSQFAQTSGSIGTLLGRRCRFNKWEPATFGMHTAMSFEEAERTYGRGRIRRAMTYKALNKLIQGSAADMTKKAMLDLYREGIIPHIQIHDELDISVIDDNQAKKIVEIMEGAVTLAIPNKVDYESGETWGDIYG